MTRINSQRARPHFTSQRAKKRVARRRPASSRTGVAKPLDVLEPQRLTLTKTQLGDVLLAVKKPGVVVAPGVPTLPRSSGQLFIVNKGVAPDYDRHPGDPKPKGPRNQSSLMVMDLATGELQKRIQLHDQAHEIAIGPDRKTAVIPHYVWTVPEHGRKEGSAVTVLDVETGKQALINLPGYTGAHGVEWIDDDHVAVTADSLGGVTDQSFILELDVRARELVRSIPALQDETHLVRLSKDRSTYFITDLLGTFNAIDRKTGELKKSVTTGDGTEGFDITPDGREIWVAARFEDKIQILDAKTLERKATLKSEGGPIRVLFTSDGKHALVTNREANSIGVFDAKTRRELERIDLKVPRLMSGAPQVRRDSGAMMISLNPKAHQAYVANSHAGVVTAIDTKTWELIGFLKAGAGPDPLAYLPR